MTTSAVDRFDTDPYDMTVLSKQFESITREMTRVLLKSARSGVINTARDFSSAITRYDSRQFMIDEGLPIHVGNVHLIPEYTLDKFDDIEPGDCFLTNSPYAGNTHHADYTLHAPVFINDEPVFWTISRAHQADVGAPIPSTYLGDAETIYEEGPHFPALRIQRDYADNEDIVRMIKLNLRSGTDQWYGDYRAQVAAVRAGENAIQDLTNEYDIETITQFADDWIAYGNAMMRHEIAQLPHDDITYTSYHDPIPTVTTEPIPITVKLAIRPGEERISVDLTDNPETIAGGYNLSKATTIAAVYGGIFHNLSSDLPHNHGSIERIEITMDSGRIVGEPDYPVGTAVATTNIAGVLLNAVQAGFGELGEPFGMAEGTTNSGGCGPVISGTDSRRNNSSFVNQLIFSAGGAPGVYGHDGWLTYSSNVSSAVTRRDSIELAEQKYPILIGKHEFTPDTAGAGKWRGAPGVCTTYHARSDPVTFTYLWGDGHQCPPLGILGGQSGAPASLEKQRSDGTVVSLDDPSDHPVTLAPGETLITHKPGGGGYGDPTDRSHTLFKRDVEDGIVSKETAVDTYEIDLDNLEN